MKKMILFLILVFSFSTNVYASVEGYKNIGDYRVPLEAYASFQDYGPGNVVTSNDISDSSGSYVNISDYYSNKYGNYYVNKLKKVRLSSSGFGVSFKFNDYDTGWGIPNNNQNTGSNWSLDGYYEGVVYLTNFDNTKFSFGSNIVNGELSSPIYPYMYKYGTGGPTANIVDKYVNYISYDGFLVTALHFKIQLKSLYVDNWLHFSVNSQDFSVGSFLTPYITGYHFQSSPDGSNLNHEYEGLIIDDIYKDNDYDRDHFNGSADVPVVVCTSNEIICFFQDVQAGIKGWLNKITDFWINKFIEPLKPYFIPDTDVIVNMGNDFVSWFDTKLGVLGFPITFSINVLNKFNTLKDTGSYSFSVPDIKVPNFDVVIIKGFIFDFADILKNPEIKVMHDVYLLIIDGLCAFSFLTLCFNKYNEIFGGPSDENESVCEDIGYSIDDDGVVHNRYSFSHKRTWKVRNGRVKKSAKSIYKGDKK